MRAKLRLRDTDARLGHAAEVLKGVLVSREPLAQALSAKRDRENPAREAKRHDEDLRDLLRVRDPHARLAEIDLRLCAGRRLVAHRRRQRRQCKTYATNLWDTGGSWKNGFRRNPYWCQRLDIGWVGRE